jgi:hypothetical protein
MVPRPCINAHSYSKLGTRPSPNTYLELPANILVTGVSLCPEGGFSTGFAKADHQTRNIHSTYVSADPRAHPEHNSSRLSLSSSPLKLIETTSILLPANRSNWTVNHWVSGSRPEGPLGPGRSSGLYGATGSRIRDMTSCFFV